jgi:hypothetical protein
VVGARFLLADVVIERQGTVVHAIARGVVALTPSRATFGGGQATDEGTPRRTGTSSRCPSSLAISVDGGVRAAAAMFRSNGLADETRSSSTTVNIPSGGDRRGP